MENSKNTAAAEALIKKAIGNLVENMMSRNIGAILWDNASAGFHYIPEVTVPGKEGDTVVRAMGLYLYDNKLYIVEEGKAPVELTEFYTDGVEVPPTVVTLTEDSAIRALGDPQGRDGYITDATDEEWLAIADCYFEALAED